MTITREERAELDELYRRHETDVDSITDADTQRTNLLRMKADFPTVGDLLRELLTIKDPEDVFVFCCDDDVPHPCDFVSFEGLIETWYAEHGG